MEGSEESSRRGTEVVEWSESSRKRRERLKDQSALLVSIGLVSLSPKIADL